MSELLSSNFYNLFGLNADFDFVARLNLQINEVLYPKGFIYKKGVKYSGFVVSNHEHDIVLLYQLKQDLIQLQIFVPFGNASNQWINSNPEEKLYRYSDYQWNFLALTKGSFRLNRSLFYSLEENNPARLDNEHLFNKTITSELHPSYTTSNGVTHSIESPLLLSTMDRDINKYLLCFSYLCNDSLYEHFGESCLIIHDPEEFERRLMNVMMERYPFLVGISSRVSYSKQEHELGILFTKDSNFKYQYEYRFLWFSDSKPEPVSYEIMSNSELLRKLVKSKDPIYIEIGNIEDIAEIRIK